jgi:hypothetical protein
VQPPPLIESRPPETLVLCGDNRRQWEDILPHMTPVCRWVDDDGKVIVRWEIPTIIAKRVGLSSGAQCSTPGCHCSNLIEINGGFLIDSNWRNVKWYFDG